MLDSNVFHDDPRSALLLDAVQHALRAPSSCNSQPWRFRVRKDVIELRADRTRALAVIDPFDRELVIACGAALFNLRVALQRFGFKFSFDVVPTPSDPDLLARVVVEGRAEPDAELLRLFDAIARRRTHRGAFDERAVPAAVTAELARCARAEGAWLHALEGEKRDAALAYLAQAERRQAHDAHVLRERAVWRLRAAPDAESATFTCAIPPDRSAGLEAEPDRARGAARPPTLWLLTTRHEEPAAWMDAGQALEHVLLRATASGVRASFHNEPLEIPSLRPALTRLSGRPGFAQFLLGLGFAPPAPPGRRRPIEDVVSHG